MSHRLLSSTSFTVLILTVAQGTMAMAESKPRSTGDASPSPRELAEVVEKPQPGQAASGFNWNLPTKTLGGRQFWGDVFFYRDWRIQRHVMTGHHRLLDGRDVRRAFGEFEHCRAELDRIRRSRNLPEMSGKAVILIHGIFRSSKSLSGMKPQLEEAGFQVFCFDYPSTQVSVDDSAEFLHQCIDSLEGIDEINFVVHSLGGVLVRTYLVEHNDPRLHRMVMLGVPNKGANMANLLQRNLLFRATYGPAGQQLVEGPEGFIAGLPTPPFEFAIVAGGRNNAKGYNPLVAGDDDGTVSVSSTRLPGASDFLLVPCLHSFLCGNEDVAEATVRFLTNGCLHESGECRPIPHPPARPASPAMPEQSGE